MGLRATYLKYAQVTFEQEYMERLNTFSVLQIYSNLLQLGNVFRHAVEPGNKKRQVCALMEPSNIAYTMS